MLLARPCAQLAVDIKLSCNFIVLRFVVWHSATGPPDSIGGDRIIGQEMSESHAFVGDDMTHSKKKHALKEATNEQILTITLVAA